MTNQIELFPVWNNIIFLTLIASYVITAIQRVDVQWYFWSWQMIFALKMFFESLIFHECNIFGHCLHQIPSDGFLIGDVSSALTMVASAVSIYLTNEVASHYYLPVMFFINYLCTLFFIDSLPMLATLFGFNLGVLIYFRFKYWIKNPKLHWKTFLAFVFFIVALTLKQLEPTVDENIDEYCWFHGFWHIFIGIACNFIILDANKIDL
jgi:hypothetical protein